MITIGSGAFGEVFFIDGKAIKKFKDFTSLVQEYSMLWYLKNNGCQFIVKVLGVNFEEQSMAMEYYQMNLRDWIRRYKDKNMYRRILTNIASGLVELHDLGLIHGDLKPNNILLNIEPWELVLGDCGFVTVAHWAKVYKTAHGYRDPNPHPDFTHDIYSFGMCISELVCDEDRKVRDPFYRDLISACLQREKSARPSARDLLLALREPQGLPILATPTLPKLPAFEVKDPLYKSLCTRIKLLQSGKDLRFRRARKLCVALTSFLNANSTIVRSRYLVYLDVALLLSSAIFGGRRMRFKTILDNYDVGSEELYSMLDLLIHDQHFMWCLMAAR